MPTPRARSRRSAVKSRTTSSAGRLAVGSSSTRISASAASARAMATSDFSVRRQALDADVRIDVGAEDLERRGGALARRAPVDHAGAARIAEGQADVLGDRHPVDQAEVLMDEGDRQAPERARRVAAAIGHRALVERVDAGEDLDERGFAGAVLAEQRDDLAGARHACRHRSAPAFRRTAWRRSGRRATARARRARRRRLRPDAVVCDGLPAGIHSTRPPVMPVRPSTAAPHTCSRAAVLKPSTLRAEDDEGIARSRIAKRIPVVTHRRRQTIVASHWIYRKEFSKPVNLILRVRVAVLARDAPVS